MIVKCRPLSPEIENKFKQNKIFDFNPKLLLYLLLKAVDTNGNCQRLAFPLGGLNICIK